MTLPILCLPRWLYHATQGGKIFRTREELDQAEASGWRDSPAAALAASVGMTVTETRSDDYVTAALEEAEDAVEQGESGAIEEALEDAEDAIEEVQKVVAKRRKR